MRSYDESYKYHHISIYICILSIISDQYPSVSSSAPSFKTLRLGGAKSINDQSSVAKSRTSRRHSSTSSPKDCKNGPRMVAASLSFKILHFLHMSYVCSFLFYLKPIKPQRIVIFKRFTENIQGTPSRERSRIQRLLASIMASMAQYLQYLTISNSVVHSVAYSILFCLFRIPPTLVFNVSSPRKLCKKALSSAVSLLRFGPARISRVQVSACRPSDLCAKGMPRPAR